MDEAAFDEPHDAVMELVLSSDDDYADADPAESGARREERQVRWRELATRFLPGVDAGAVLALAGALVGLTVSGTIEILAQNREIADTATSSRGISGAAVDPLSAFRSMDHARFLGQAAFAAAAVVVAFVVLTRWRSERHARWSRPVGQAALVLGLIGVTIGLLGYADVIGGLPAPSEFGHSGYTYG